MIILTGPVVWKSQSLGLNTHLEERFLDEGFMLGPNATTPDHRPEESSQPLSSVHPLLVASSHAHVYVCLHSHVTMLSCALRCRHAAT